ncbi:hypothetical protein AHAS_Ahas09G0030900 [Arachis hypogaea]
MTSRSSKTTRASSTPSFRVVARHVQLHMEEKEKGQRRGMRRGRGVQGRGRRRASQSAGGAAHANWFTCRSNRA